MVAGGSMSSVADMESLLEQARLLAEQSRKILEQGRESKAVAQLLAAETRVLVQRTHFFLQGSVRRRAADKRHAR